VATITMTLNEAVTVTGNPKLSLNDGGTATYSSGSGTATLTFRYKVAAGQDTTRLAVTGVTLPSGASVMGAGGVAADFAGAAGSLNGRLVVDTSRTRTNIANGTGQTVNAGTGNDVVVLRGGDATLVFNGSDNVAFLGGSANAVNATINDKSRGLTVYVLNGGIDKMSGLATDTTAVSTCSEVSAATPASRRCFPRLRVTTPAVRCCRSATDNQSTSPTSPPPVYTLPILLWSEAVLPKASVSCIPVLLAEAWTEDEIAHLKTA
jgi:hypothetical protein